MYTYTTFMHVIHLTCTQELGKPDYLTSMTSAYDLLLKFVINLLKPNRPPVWRSIKTNNTAFKARVACMKGYADILRTAGYTERDENSLQFPEHVQEPDKTKLYVIAAELLMARLEVDQMNNAIQQQQQQQQEAIRQSPSQRRAQTTFIGSTTGNGQGGYQSQNYGGQQAGFQQHAPSSMASYAHTQSPPLVEQQQLHQQQQPHLYHKSQSHDPLMGRQPQGQGTDHPMTSGSFTVNLGSPSELAGRV